MKRVGMLQRTFAYKQKIREEDTRGLRVAEWNTPHL